MVRTRSEILAKYSKGVPGQTAHQRSTGGGDFGGGFRQRGYPIRDRRSGLEKLTKYSERMLREDEDDSTRSSRPTQLW